LLSFCHFHAPRLGSLPKESAAGLGEMLRQVLLLQDRIQRRTTASPGW
jgi:hypothetical protein